MGTLHIAIISGVQGDTRRYRAFHFYEQCCLAGISCYVGHIALPQTRMWVDSAQILILQRVAWDSYVARLVNRARRRGALILSDVDDLIFDPESMHWIDSPDFADPVRVTLYRENLLRNRTTLLESDAVIASTEFLAEQVRQLGKPAWVHRNAFSLEMLAASIRATWSPSEVQNEPIVIGYASGTPTHDRDFALVLPSLRSLLLKDPRLVLHLVGHLKADIADFKDRVIRCPFVPWRKLPEILAQFSINLAPLRVDNPFSQSKSEIKYIEAALVGVPTIASPTQSFQYAIRSGENGMLASSEEDWENAINYLVDDPTFRVALGKAAFGDVMERYAPWRRARELVFLLNQVFETLSAPFGRLEVRDVFQPDPADFTRYFVEDNLERHPTLLERGIYSLCWRGPLTLIGEMWVYIRRLISPLIPFPPR